MQKSIKVSETTWKILRDLKHDRDLSSVDEVIKQALVKAGFLTGNKEVNKQ